LALEGGVGKPAADGWAGEPEPDTEPEEAGVVAGDAAGVEVGVVPPPLVAGVLLLADVAVLAPHARVPIIRPISNGHSTLNRIIFLILDSHPQQPECLILPINPDYSIYSTQNNQVFNLIMPGLT
jgi:hypothetical protein